MFRHVQDCHLAEGAFRLPRKQYLLIHRGLVLLIKLSRNQGLVVLRRNHSAF